MFVAELTTKLALARGPYASPTNSGTQMSLARVFTSLLLETSPVYLHVTCWSTGLSTEVLDLFYRYRSSFGETRFLIEAPVHVFGGADHDALLSVLSMVFFFFWDASVFDAEGRWLLQTSHDGWLEIRARDESDVQRVITALDHYPIPTLSEAK
jgi:hypothetical protein